MEQASLQSGKSAQSWRDLAERLSRETDLEKIANLSQELIRAIDEESLKKKTV